MSGNRFAKVIALFGGKELSWLRLRAGVIHNLLLGIY